MGSTWDNERRARFRDYFIKVLGGDRAAFLRKTGYTKGRLNQLLDDEKPFGEKASLELARRLREPPEIFEPRRSGTAVRMPAGDQRRLNAEEEMLLRLWAPLFPEQRAELVEALKKAHAHATSTWRELKRRGYIADVPATIGAPPESHKRDRPTAARPKDRKAPRSEQMSPDRRHPARNRPSHPSR